MLKTEKKQEIIKKHKIHKTDTGSPEVQIAILSKEIKSLLGHLKKHPKDIHSRQGLLKMVHKRRSLLKYLELEDKKRYNKTIKALGLKDASKK